MIGVCVDMKAQQRSWNNGGQHHVGGQVDSLLDAQLHHGHPVQQACLKSQLRWRSHLTAPDLFYYPQVGGFGCLPHHTCSSCQRYPKSHQTTPLCIRWAREGFKIKITSEKIGFTQLYGNLVAWKSILGKSIARMSYHSAQPKRQPLFSSNNSNDILYLYLGVSNVQAGRTWMIYLDRVDKGMES